MNEETLRLLEYEGMKDLFLPHLACDLGKAALAGLHPFDSAEGVREALDLSREAASVLDRGCGIPMGGIHDLGPLLDRVRDHGRPLEPEELFTAQETFAAAATLVSALEGAARDEEDLELPRLRALAGEIPGFTVLCDLIGDVVDERGRVRDTASPRLADLRRHIAVTRERIEKKIAELLCRKEFRRCLQEATLRYRSGRVVLPVKAERRGELRGILHDVSQTGATCFVEPEAVVPDGNALEDLLAGERREVTRVLWETTVKVLEFEGPIRTAMDALARLDLALCAAKAAREHGLAFPELNEEGVVRFSGARHPILLLLKGRDAVVPADLRMGEDFHLLIITGPNTGGKTVALKTLGLLSLMAHSGLPVPASRAAYSPYHDIFADIGDEQSLQQSLSTFSSHMSRIARFLSRADDRTLILLDELGSGTDPVEGAALGRAILDFLHDLRAPAAITTHLGALKTYAFTHEGVSNASVEFDVETLSPTFRLLIGQPGASNALTIADRLGIPAAVISEARELVRPEDRMGQEILSKAQEIRSRAEKHVRETEGMRSEASQFLARAEAECLEAEGRRKHVEKEAEDEMEAVLSRIRRLVVEFAKAMENAPKPFGPRAKEFLRRAEEEIRATPLLARREEFALSLHRGDEVFVPKLKEKFLVHAVRKRNRTVVLIRGGIKVEVAFAEVSWIR